jgi:hypothetical protein
MPKFKVRYTGQWDEEIEAYGQGEAEQEAARRNEDCWIAEEIYEEEKEEAQG